MICHRIGNPPISIIGLGRRWLSSDMRVPYPPASMTTFSINDFLKVISSRGKFYGSAVEKSSDRRCAAPPRGWMGSTAAYRACNPASSTTAPCQRRARLRRSAGRRGRFTGLPRRLLRNGGPGVQRQSLASFRKIFRFFPKKALSPLTIRSPLHRDRLPAGKRHPLQHRRVDATGWPPPLRHQCQFPRGMAPSRVVGACRARGGMAAEGDVGHR